MKRIHSITALIAAGLTSAASLSAQTTLEGSGLEVQVRNNGAIEEASLNGVGFWAQGFRNMPIADYNVQLDGQLYYAGATGVDTVGLSQNGAEADFLGVLASKLGVSRNYSIFEGAPVLQVELSYTNVSGSALTFSGREVFDADPGNAFNMTSFTHNDLAALGGRLVAESWAGGANDYAFVTGFKTETDDGFSTYVRGSDGGFEDGYVAPQLSSRDSDGLYIDETVSLNYALNLDVGETFRIVYLQAFGASLDEAEANFLTALAASDHPSEAVSFVKEVLVEPAFVAPVLLEVAQVDEPTVYELPALHVSAGTEMQDAIKRLSL